MTGRLVDLWAGLREARARRRADETWRRQDARRVRAAVERVVDRANPQLRALGGYRRRLEGVVRPALDYCRSLAETIPGPVVLDRRQWMADPLVNALFGSPQRLRSALTNTTVCRFLKEMPSSTDDCYALLLATPTIRNQTGVGLIGSTLRRDVPQATLSFSDHRVILPSFDLAGLRANIERAGLDALVGAAVAELVEHERRIAEIEDRLRIVRLKHRITRAPDLDLDLVGEPAVAQHAEHLALGERIADLERKLGEARRGFVGLDDYLSRLAELLGDPAHLIGTTREQVRVDRMNVIRRPNEPQQAAELDLVRGRRGGKVGRVMLMVRFPRAELISEEERSAAFDRYVNASRPRH